MPVMPNSLIFKYTSKFYVYTVTLLWLRLKNRPWEVKETLLPGKCPFASERHLCPQAMQK
jgi:hypothetical protein